MPTQKSTAKRFTRKPPPPDMSPKTVTGYHVETNLTGKTQITLTLRKGGTVPLVNLDPTKALLYLDLLRNSGLRTHAIFDPKSKTLDWRQRPVAKS